MVDFVVGFQPFQIGEVLRSARRALVLDQMLSRQYGSWFICEPRLHSGGPRTRELDAVYRRQDVDADWCHTDLENETWLREVGLRQIVQGRSERTQGIEHLSGIGAFRSDPYIEFLRCPNMTMCGQGVDPYHEVFNAMRVERG